MSQARPHNLLRLVIAKRSPDAANSQRVENTRESQPDIGITRISAIRYEVWTQDNSSWLAESPPPISLSEDATIWISSVAMKKPRHISANAKTLVRVGRFIGLTGAAGAAAPVAGDWVMTGRARRRAGH